MLLHASGTDYPAIRCCRLLPGRTAIEPQPNYMCMECGSRARAKLLKVNQRKRGSARALVSEGRGRTFDSCRVRQSFQLSFEQCLWPRIGQNRGPANPL
jgi:hypothetical protein